jgi:hypothetical protein
MSTPDPLPPLARSAVLGVVREAMRERVEERLLLLHRDGPGRLLLARWLKDAGMDVAPVDAAPAERGGIVLDPADKLTLLRDGPLPGAEVLPLGDVWPSELVEEDPAASERALRAAFDEGHGLDALDRHLPHDEAADLRRRVLRVAPLLRAPTVPKLTEWTVGIDPGP